MRSLPSALRLATTALLALELQAAGCRGADLTCLSCLDTFVIYVKGEGDWLGEGYRLEVEADDQIHRCPTGTAERIGDGPAQCGKSEDAPLIWVRGSEDEPVVRIGFWEAAPSDVRVRLLDGDEILARGHYEPIYEEVPAGQTCPVCIEAESETLRLEDSSATSTTTATATVIAARGESRRVGRARGSCVPSSRSGWPRPGSASGKHRSVGNSPEPE